MAACRRIGCFAKNSKSYLFRPHKLYSTGTQAKSDAGSSEIVIPYKIDRGPTDILKALSSTIKKDFTAAHYKYEDDPYMIPSSNITKRSFALSKESGKKAARYFLEKYPEYFKCHESVPHIKAFHPPVIYTEENVSNVETLKNCISDFELDNAVLVYDILKKKGIAVSQDVKQDLLQLLCYYNSEQPASEEYYEERFFARADESTRKWNANGMAEKLFEEMEKDNLAYSTMIAGASKFLDADRALILYDEMKEKGFPGTLEAYNHFIPLIPIMKEDFATRWEFVTRLLSTMISEGIHPDLHTMNSVLEVLSRTARWKKSLHLSLRVLSEMKRLNIEPSLGSYYYILLLHCSFDFRNANILYDIMNEIENLEHTVRHPSDVNFFSSAMEVCWKGVGDKTLCHRIHNLLEYKNNCKILGNAFFESQYFKALFKCLCDTEEIDQLMEVYDKYVPNSYTPEPGVTLSVVQAIHFAGAYQYLPKMCSDVLFFEQTDREKILEVLMEAAGCIKHEEQVQTNLVQMVWNIVQKLKVREELRKLSFDWTGALLGNILKTFVNGKDIEKAWYVIQKLREQENYIAGFPEKKALLKFCGLCLENSDYDKLNYAIKYAVNSAYPDFREDVANLANEMVLEKKLSESQRAHISSLFQSSSYDEDESSSSSSDESSSSDDSSDDETNVDDPPNVNKK